jgi:hypothetical protein
LATDILLKRISLARVAGAVPDVGGVIPHETN